MSLYLSMLLFSVSMSVSPGPVNLVAMTSGLNYGFYPSFKFVSGATIGFIALLFFIGFGLGEVNDRFPEIVNFLRYIGCGYIFYVGYKIFNTVATMSYEEQQKKPSFNQGWLMQWLNPKAWVACLAGCSAFNVYSSDLRLIQFLSIYFVICYLGIASWALLGQKIQLWVSSDKHVKYYNRAMGTTLCILAVVILIS